MHKAVLTLQQKYPQRLIDALFWLQSQIDFEIFLAGGVVRDALLGRAANDLDLVVARDARRCCGMLQRFLGAGALVPLGEGVEESCRLVYDNVVVDIAIYRNGVATLKEDLALRDFTINAMALPLAALRGEGVELIDPLAGAADLDGRQLRCCDGSCFVADPLRIIRAFRFAAIYDLDFGHTILQQVTKSYLLLKDVAAERISHELDLFFAAPFVEKKWGDFFDSGLLQFLLPELAATHGVQQPDAHHLDVFAHSVAAFMAMKQLLGACPPYQLAEVDYDDGLQLSLLWAALLHDIGKVPCRSIREKDGQIIFYGHDHRGAEMVEAIADRLRWSGRRRSEVMLLVDLHMYPFHLLNVERGEEVTVRAIMRFYRRAGLLLPAVFKLAIADSIASQGPGKPENLELDLVEMYQRFSEVHRKQIAPALASPLLNGGDLIAECDLAPSPLFGKILLQIQELQAAGKLQDRDGALLWVKKYLQSCSKCKKNVM